MEETIPLSNTKIVKNNNIEEVTNFEVVDISKIDIEGLIGKIGKERVTEMIKIIMENNIKMMEIKIKLIKLEEEEKEKKQRL